MNIISKVVTAVKQDHNLSRVYRGTRSGAKELPAATAQYLGRKIPIAHWILGYKPQWLIGDVIAGQSAGLLMIVQAGIFAAVAGVPIKYGLLASWLPGFLYAILGTSRNISPGPTAAGSVFAASVIKGLVEHKIPPALGLAALSLSTGIWSLACGVLNLGFVFDLISLPIALGFLLGASIRVLLEQLPIIFGQEGVTKEPASILIDILKKMGRTKPETLGLAVASFSILIIMQYLSNKFGSKMAIIRILCSARSLLVLVAFTAISYFFNKDLETSIWATVGDVATPFPHATVPINLQIVKGVILPGLLLFVTTSLEHVALGKAFAHQERYPTVDISQEFIYLGVINLLSAPIGALPVSGGDVTRACVLSASGVHSPLAALVASGTVLTAILIIGPYLSTIPLATAAAVTFVAVLDKMPPQSIMGVYWKTSFVDFIHFLIAFNITLLQTSLAGITAAIAFMILFTIFRTMFAHHKVLEAQDIEARCLPIMDVRPDEPWVPRNMCVVQVAGDLCYLNADRLRRQVLHSVYLRHAKFLAVDAAPDRAWNDRPETAIAAVRRRHGVETDPHFPRPSLHILVFDMSRVAHLDVSGLEALLALKRELRAFAGRELEFRFVHASSKVLERFIRHGWALHVPGAEAETALNVARKTVVAEVELQTVDGADRQDVLFDCLSDAVRWDGRRF